MRIIQIGCRSRPGSPRRTSPDASCSSGGVVAPDNGQAAQSRPNSAAKSQPRGRQPTALVAPLLAKLPYHHPLSPGRFSFFFLIHWPLLLAAETPEEKLEKDPNSGRKPAKRICRIYPPTLFFASHSPRLPSILSIPVSRRRRLCPSTQRTREQAWGFSSRPPASLWG